MGIIRLQGSQPLPPLNSRKLKSNDFDERRSSTTRFAPATSSSASEYSLMMPFSQDSDAAPVFAKTRRRTSMSRLQGVAVGEGSVVEKRRRARRPERRRLGRGSGIDGENARAARLAGVKWV